MMKKLGVLGLVIGLVMVFALPASAVTVGDKNGSITIGGWFTLDTLYKGVDKNFQTYVASPTGGGKDKTMWVEDVPFWSFMYVMLNVGPFKGYAEIATSVSREYNNYQGISYSGSTAGTSLNTGVGSSTNVADFLTDSRWYGAYTFGNCELQVGKNDGWLVSSGYGVYPTSTLGYSAGATTHVALIGWGWQYDGKNANIRFKQDISKMFGYQIALVDTGTYGETWTPTGATSATIRQSYASYPTIAAKIMLNFGPVALYPAAAYQHVTWDALPAGYTDNMTSWTVLLPLIAKFGPFTGTMQLSYGMNTGGPTSGNVLMRGQNANTGYLRNASGGLLDTTNITGYFEAGFTFGPVTPHIWYSFDWAQNDKWKNIATANDYYQRTTYGINAYYKVSNNFLIVPEVAFYDYGTNPGYSADSGYKFDIGKEWLAGIHFRFNF